MTHDDDGPPPGLARGTAHLRVFQPLAAFPDAVQARLIAGGHRTRAEVEAEAAERARRRLARPVADAVRAGEDLTIDATPLLSEEGRLLAVESGRRGPEDVSSGSPFHADPVSDDGARLEPTSRPDD